MGAMTVANRIDSNVTIHPGIPIAVGPQAGKIVYSGAFRAVRCRLTGSGSYATGGDTLPDVGLKHIEAILVIATNDAAAINTDGNTLEFQTSGANAGKVKMYSTGSNTEVANATSLVGASWEVIILGRSG